MPKRAVWAEIDLAAVEHNIREIKKKIHGGAKFCAVVKADAYGHGAVPVANVALKLGASYLAVAMLSEAIELREAGITAPILILGPTPEDEAKELVDYGITPAVFTLSLAEAISREAQRQQKTAKVHLKIDTGMSRIGVRPEAAGELGAAIAALPGIELEGVFSHFALADSRNKDYAKEQLARFELAIAKLKEKGIEIPLKHLANSAATLEMPETHFDMVRMGVIIYGLWPSAEVEHVVDLKPAMKVKGHLALVKTMHPGETIGYGRTYTVAKESRIATLPIGYADGYIRALAGKAAVEFADGRRAPVVGRICMDQCMLDVTGIAEAKEGSEVVIFGSDTLTADEVAEWLGTINYEVVCLMSPRIPRIYHG